MSCPLCERLTRGESESTFIKTLESGVLYLGDYQAFRGHVMFVSNVHAVELFELEKNIRAVYLEEMSQVANAVYKAFSPKKINYELLGNVVGHLHWHIIPRYNGDAAEGGTVWTIDEVARGASTYDTDETKRMVLEHL